MPGGHPGKATWTRPEVTLFPRSQGPHLVSLTRTRLLVQPCQLRSRIMDPGRASCRSRWSSDHAEVDQLAPVVTSSRWPAWRRWCTVSA